MSRTHIFIPDTQVKPNVDMTYLSAIGEYIAFKKPDVIVHIGDHADMPSLSSYDKGKEAAEGRRYHKDIDAAIQGMDLLVSPIKAAIQKDKKWKPRLVFTNGNHESYSRCTSVLSKNRGWIGVSEVESEDELAQFSQKGISFAKPIHYTTKPFKGNLLKFQTPTNQFVVTPKHEVVLSDFTKKLAEEVTLQDSLVEPVPMIFDEIEQDPLITKLLTWTVCDGCIIKGKSTNPIIQFQLSRQDKIINLENLLQKLNFNYTKHKSEKYSINKPQSFYIRIYGDYAKKIIKRLYNKKEFGDWVFRLKKENLYALEEALLEGDEYDNATSFKSIDFKSLINLQIAFLKIGYNPSLQKLNNSGFGDSNTQYELELRKPVINKSAFSIEGVPYDDNVFCFTMPEGTLVTLQDGRLGFSGNCRIQRFAEDNPLMYGKVSLADLQYQKFGWEVHDFLKPVEIDGIMYCHFFANPFSGKPYGGSATNILAKVGKSFSQGHKQTFDVTQRYLPTGERQIGLVAGAAYPWDESYKGYQGNKHFRGLVVKHRVQNGSYDLMQVSLDYLIERYKNRHNIPKPEYLPDSPTINLLMNEILERHPRVYMMGERSIYELIQDTTFTSLLNGLSDNLIKELKTRNFIEDISYTNSQELKEVISKGRVTVDGLFASLI